MLNVYIFCMYVLYVCIYVCEGVAVIPARPSACPLADRILDARWNAVSPDRLRCDPPNRSGRLQSARFVGE